MWKAKSERSYHDDAAKGHKDWTSRNWRHAYPLRPKWPSKEWAPGEWATKSKASQKCKDWKHDEDTHPSTWRYVDSQEEQPDPEPEEGRVDGSGRNERHSQHRAWSWFSPSFYKTSNEAVRKRRGREKRNEGYLNEARMRTESLMFAGAQSAQMRAAWVEATISGLLMAGHCGNDHILQDWMARSTASANDLAIVERCLSELNDVVGKVDKTWCVKPFGSHVSGLACKGSDLDATCLMMESTKEDPGGQSALHALEWVLRPILLCHPSFTVTQQILQARVPILKLRFEDALDVDLSCHNVQPLRNTSLIQAYVELAPIVRNFVLAVKTWAKAADVCGAKQSKLSIYTFSLMAIYFLQIDPIVQLPALNTQSFSHAGLLPGQVLPTWSCKVPLSALLVRFFRFYSSQFDWGAEVVSVRLGQRLRPEADEFSLLAYRSSRRIHIEDPFALQRNLHCVLGAREERELQKAFMDASRMADELDGLAQWPASLHEQESSPFVQKFEGRDRREGQSASVDNITLHSNEHRSGETLLAELLAPSSACVPSTILAPKSGAKHVHYPRRHPDVSLSAAMHRSRSTWLSIAEDEDMCWLLSFVVSCCAYALYAMFTGQVFRLSLATAALFTVLLVIEPRRRNEKTVPESADGEGETLLAQTFKAWLRRVGRRGRPRNFARLSR